MTGVLGVATSNPALSAGLVVLAAMVGVVRRWIVHRTAVRREIEKTRRLVFAVPGTEAGDRAAVLRALAQLEAASPPARGDGRRR